MTDRDLLLQTERAEAELARLRDAVEEYLLWEPGRAGHAAAHRRLREALNGDDRG